MTTDYAYANNSNSFEIFYGLAANIYNKDKSKMVAYLRAKNLSELRMKLIIENRKTIDQ